MNGITVKETAEKLGITPWQVETICAKGRIPGAVCFDHAWVIPSDATKLKDECAVSMPKNGRVQ